MSTAYLNGEFLPKEQARVSVLDRGFLFGDGVYEVIPVYGGKLFRLEQHLDRLDQSLAGIRLTNPHTRREWCDILAQLVARHGGGDQSMYLQVTRGAAPKRDHAFPADTLPTVFVMSTPFTPNSPEIAERGVAAITLEDIRWKYCHIKAITLLANVLMRQQAVDNDAAEAILIRNGEVTEGTASNVFIVRGGVLITPPKGPFLLPGITRDLILELAAGNDIPHRERPVPEAELFGADEIWVTNSTREILPVTKLNQTAIGGGRPGPLWARMTAIYQDYKERVRRGQDS